jgi:hypothetical protein
MVSWRQPSIVGFWGTNIFRQTPIHHKSKCGGICTTDFTFTFLDISLTFLILSPFMYTVPQVWQIAPGNGHGWASLTVAAGSTIGCQESTGTFFSLEMISRCLFHLKRVLNDSRAE